MPRTPNIRLVPKSIRFKLFSALLLTTLLAVAGMYAFMRWSLDRGFAEFVETRQQERLNVLLENLGDYYATDPDWTKLAKDKRKWLELLMQSREHPRRLPLKWLKHGPEEALSVWPPAPPEHERRFRPLELSVMLLRADKSIVFGRSEALEHLTLHPIRHQQSIVGYLGVLPGKALHQPIELQFIEKQSRSFIWIALLTLLLSALFALVLAYALGRPLKRIAQAVRTLAKGRYDLRLPVESSDELGQLARDFNEMAAVLEQSELARRRWIADISHELRTPIALLRGELEALQDNIRPLTREAVDSLYGDVLRLNRLTDDLYQLSLSDRGALAYRKSPTDPVAILQADIAAMTPEFSAKSFSVALHDRCGGRVSLYADPDRLSQLFRNLLSNSAHYTDQGGRLDLTLSVRNGHFIAEFADSAPSVPPSALPHLFDRFYRVEGSRCRNHGGAGLGLAICSNIVDAHGGRIGASASDSGGLSIRIELPVNE